MKKTISSLFITLIITGCQQEIYVGDPGVSGHILIVNESDSEVIINDYYPTAYKRSLQSNDENFPNRPAVVV